MPPGGRLAYETTFPAAAGRLTLQYRADFRFEAVVVDAPGPRRRVLSGSRFEKGSGCADVEDASSVRSRG